MTTRYLIAGALLALAVALFAVAFIGLSQADRAVCHSATEDSIITDCDYRHGAWYPR
jgi:hypothetical protein